MSAPDNATIKAVMSELGRRGGQSTSDAKRKAVRQSLAKARESRWSNSKPPTDTAKPTKPLTVRPHSLHSRTRPIAGCADCLKLA